MRIPNPKGAAGPWILLLAVALLAAPAQAQDLDLSDHPWIDEPAPDFRLPSVGGDTLALADLRGEYVVLHFGTSW